MRRLVVVLATVLLIAGCGGSSRLIDRPAFHPETAAAYGSANYWVLGDYRCGTQRWCTKIVRSTDGGRHFSRVGSPPFPSDGPVPTILFADDRDGFSYIAGGGPLYVTHDGGKTWRTAGPQHARPVHALAIGGDEVYAITDPRRLEISKVSSISWHGPKPLPLNYHYPISLAARGRRLWVLGRPRRLHPDHADVLYRSSNGGRTFTASDGCFSDFGGSLVPAGGGVLWAVCPSGMMASLERSTDDGRSFVPFSAESRPLLLPNSARIAASSPRDAVLARADGPLLRTTDRGLHWRTVKGTEHVTTVLWLGFGTRRIGAAVVEIRGDADRAELWRTTDGGTTWRSVPIR